MNALLLCIRDESDCDLSRLWSLLSPWQPILHAYHHLLHSNREEPCPAIDTPGWDPPRLRARDGALMVQKQNPFSEKIVCHCFFWNDLVITHANRYQLLFLKVRHKVCGVYAGTFRFTNVCFHPVITYIKDLRYSWCWLIKGMSSA